jgi:hypothetical protein
LQRMYVVWVDVNGFTRLTLINTLTGAAVILADMVHVSLADWLNVNEAGFTINPSPVVSAGTYQRVADCASLMFTAVSGDKIVLQLPAPQSAVFLADQQTVDPAFVATLVADCIGVLTTSSGSPATAFVGGYRRPTTRENYQ